jgi:hypothetical protein
MKKQLALALVPALLALASFPAWGSDGDIVMLATLQGTTDQQGYECDFWLIKHNNGKGNSPFGACLPPVITVYGELKGASAGGISGVEFAVEYNGSTLTPSGYIIIPLPLHGASTNLGNPFNGGGNLTWNSCNTGDMYGRIPLYQVITFSAWPCGPSQRPPQLDIVVASHSAPSNPFFRCPLFTLCDDPAFTKVCLGDDLYMCERQQPPFPMDATCSTSGTFSINAPSSGVGGCNPPPSKMAANPSVEDDTWSNVKALYR